VAHGRWEIRMFVVLAFVAGRYPKAENLASGR